ncbi:MAG: hypothetical protein MRY83_09365 [Flavobacteriales bacterium]|nr:hypothetical protein [Flavobacteriales bacterium]
MKKLDVKHYLGIYLTRKQMQEDGITNPSIAIKTFTLNFVSKLSKMPLDEEIIIEGNAFIDSKGNIIATRPSEENE